MGSSCQAWSGSTSSVAYRPRSHPLDLRSVLPAFDQMLAARRWFVGLRPEVRDSSDQPVVELEERHSVVGTVLEAPLKPHHPVPLVSDHDLWPQMPVAGVLLIELQVAITSADTLP